MIFTEADFIKQNKIIINEKATIMPELLKLSPNIKAVGDLIISGVIFYHPDLRVLEVKAVLSGEIIVEDARTLEEFKMPINIDWNDEYSFIFFKKSDINYLNEQNFDIIKYAWDEIIMNIPINLSRNSDKIINGDSTWQVFSEEEFTKYQANQGDSRWEQLHEVFAKKKEEEK